MIIDRYVGNPILSKEKIPYKSTLVFNAGVTKYKGKYIMIFRNDFGEFSQSDWYLKTNLGIAYSDDGIDWEVSAKPFLTTEDALTFDSDIRRIYDPRLTVIDNKCYICFAVDTNHGIRGGIGVTNDFNDFKILSLSVPDNRNMVLFPEKIGGKYLRLERPFPVYGRGGGEKFDIWLSDSPDLKYWGSSQLLLSTEDVPFANSKIGPAAPPIKTENGWLTLFHAVDLDRSRGKNGWEDSWQKVYTTGIMLLDLEDPSKILGMSKSPLIVPEDSYEREGGFRNNVIFPGGMILEENGQVKIYYGAADTVECLATADLDDLLKLCLDSK